MHLTLCRRLVEFGRDYNRVLFWQPSWTDWHCAWDHNPLFMHLCCFLAGRRLVAGPLVLHLLAPLWTRAFGFDGASWALAQRILPSVWAVSLLQSSGTTGALHRLWGGSRLKQVDHRQIEAEATLPSTPQTHFYSSLWYRTVPWFCLILELLPSRSLCLMLHPSEARIWTITKISYCWFLLQQ